MINRRRVLACATATLSTTFWRRAGAHQYPDHPVRIVVPFAAGAPDSVARIIAQQLQIQTKQSFVVENRPAANGTVGTDSVAKSPPDGYTLLVPSSSIVVNPSIYRALPYDVVRDLEPVTPIARGDGYILVVNPSVAATSVQELLALARKPDSKLSYGSPGVGNTLHLAAELFKARAEIDITHVPYRGAGPAINDLIGGQIQVMFVTPPLSLEHIRSGRLRPLGYTAAKRWPVLPNVPTMAEAGVKDFVLDGGWYGMFAPAKTPGDIVGRLHQAVKAALTAPEVQKNIATLGLAPFEIPPADFKVFVAAQIRMYAELVRLAKLDPQ
jgi:tripartite-type tricarboxylate transporter receptor subunit TctC